MMRKRGEHLMPIKPILISLAILLFYSGSIFYTPMLKAASIVEHTDKSRNIYKKIKSFLARDMERKGFNWGSPVYFRAFKSERTLEAWIEKDGTYHFFKSYFIYGLSGKLGPKYKQGDYQVPEGFYTVYPRQMHPKSKYHLAFNIGYPNPFDRAKGWTGDYIMVHGDTGSSGCLAMKNQYIEEIYALAYAALSQGQKFFRIDLFPFRMTDARTRYLFGQETSAETGFFGRTIKWLMDFINQHRFPEKSATLQSVPYKEIVEFWKALKKGYDIFEYYKVPAKVEVIQGEYSIKPPNA
jgi:murein L,D-transpeptidase YafK